MVIMLQVPGHWCITAKGPRGATPNTPASRNGLGGAAHTAPPGHLHQTSDTAARGSRGAAHAWPWFERMKTTRSAAKTTGRNAVNYIGRPMRPSTKPRSQADEDQRRALHGAAQGARVLIDPQARLLRQPHRCNYKSHTT